MIGHDARTGVPVRLAREGDTLAPRPTEASAEEGVYVGPGWIDVQVNGFAGVDVNDPDTSAGAFEAMTEALQRTGVTRFLPTVVTADAGRMAACLRAVRDARVASPLVRAGAIGLHLEGPFISQEDGARGAHPRAEVRDPDPASFDLLQEAAGGGIRLVTLAPERPGALELIRYLRGHGIVVALGHTLADEAAIREAADAGATLSTHLGNGVPATLPRHPNVLWSQLAEDRLHASAIFDGHHLPREFMRVLYAVKGARRLVLTSDAVALAGCAPGVYHGQVGGTVELRADGRLSVQGTPYLAGSASSLLDGVRSAVARVGVPPREALRMVSDTPAALLGLDDRNDWTVVRVRRAGAEILAVVVEGRSVYEAPKA